ncbi:hypothetical protein FNV43_RR23689 [Rhamnella rubrinervis]|uniref:X8 domain-containing protein n=1 Tax=Rhamnella rubrinervis TaxID=2594499 RepID=A0A8K0E4A3_9ROSA|nr:hypothetical protein FNV43_RR23689 [Rhamnella rubrinervis]
MEVTITKTKLILGIAFLLCFAACTESRNFSTESYQEANTGDEIQATWCIAKPSTEDEKLRENIEYSCGQSGVECGTIQTGGSCFNPDNLVSHASVSMNLFYRAAGKHSWNCHFSGTALIVYQNPCNL